MRAWFQGLRNLFQQKASKSEGTSRTNGRKESSGQIKIVALVSSEHDRGLLSRLATEHHWTLRLADTSEEAWEALNESKAPIVLCDRELSAADWRDVVHRMGSSNHGTYPILVSRVADDYLWKEVIRLGGHDLLATPLREEDVLRAIRLAWSYWNTTMKVLVNGQL
jgi:DNA-binding NtrC family response regulator